MYPGMMTAGALVGLLVRILAGLTGIGGGLLLLPLLVSVLDAPPIVAVGADAVISWITEIGAGGLHCALGSIPGAFLGVVVLVRVRATYGNAVNDFLRMAVGALLVVIQIVYLAGQSLACGCLAKSRSHPMRVHSRSALSAGAICGT